MRKLDHDGVNSVTWNGVTQHGDVVLEGGGSSAVTSVNGEIGDVVLKSGDIHITTDTTDTKTVQSEFERIDETLDVLDDKQDKIIIESESDVTISGVSVPALTVEQLETIHDDIVAGNTVVVTSSDGLKHFIPTLVNSSSDDEKAIQFIYYSLLITYFVEDDEVKNTFINLNAGGEEKAICEVTNLNLGEEKYNELMSLMPNVIIRLVNVVLDGVTCNADLNHISGTGDNAIFGAVIYNPAKTEETVVIKAKPYHYSDYHVYTLQCFRERLHAPTIVKFSSFTSDTFYNLMMGELCWLEVSYGSFKRGLYIKTNDSSGELLIPAEADIQYKYGNELPAASTMKNGETFLLTEDITSEVVIPDVKIGDDFQVNGKRNLPENLLVEAVGGNISSFYFKFNNTSYSGIIVSYYESGWGKLQFLAGAPVDICTFGPDGNTMWDNESYKGGEISITDGTTNHIDTSTSFGRCVENIFKACIKTSPTEEKTFDKGLYGFANGEFIK